MKSLIFVCALLMPILSGCDAWTVEPLPYISPTAFPSSTPIILSATPIILPPPITATGDVTPLAPANTSTPNGTDTPSVTETIAVTPTTPVPLTFTPTITSTPSASVSAKILGCNTSIDITHGMGEVTNAYVTIANTGDVNLTNICATLNALDEGRPHPDKTKCVASLPIGYQVSEKLTVDTTLKESSPVQVDITLGGGLLQRLAQNACTDFDLLPPHIGNLGKITLIPTP